MAEGINPLFTEYSKITDTLTYLDSTHALQICVSLMKKNNKDNRIMSYHSEYKYYNSNLERQTYSIKRNISAYMLINDFEDYDNSILLGFSDIPVLQMLFDQKIMGWFMGANRLFELVDGKLTLKSNDNAQFPLSERSFLEFTPMLIEYTDGTLKEGVRMYMNAYDNFVDMSIDKFMELYYYITRVDLYNAALNMLNYVKIQPYGINVFDMTEKQESYFDKQ